MWAVWRGAKEVREAGESKEDEREGVGTEYVGNGTAGTEGDRRKIVGSVRCV